MGKNKVGFTMPYKHAEVEVSMETWDFLNKLREDVTINEYQLVKRYGENGWLRPLDHDPVGSQPVRVDVAMRKSLSNLCTVAGVGLVLRADNKATVVGRKSWVQLLCRVWWKVRAMPPGVLEPHTDFMVRNPEPNKRDGIGLVRANRVQLLKVIDYACELFPELRDWEVTGGRVVFTAKGEKRLGGILTSLR